MGYRYENKLEEEEERRFLMSLPAWKRRLYKLTRGTFLLLGFMLAFYATIGWWLVKLF